MRYVLILLFILGWTGVGPARAADVPTIAPVPEWVEPVAIPKPDPALADRPAQALLLSSQTFYGADGDQHHLRVATLVQNVQGLAAGNIALPWEPTQSDLLIHSVRIIRDGKTIDLLSEGGEFTVLRRENNLEAAMLDGVLTAAMQAEGLQVGDILELSFTYRRKPGALATRGEDWVTLLPGQRFRRLFHRSVWHPSRSIRWRGTGLLEKVEVRNGRFGKEIVRNLTDAEAPAPPLRAPSRYMLPALLQVTEYRDWEEISRLMAPLYAEARTLREASPLRARIDRIAAASADPTTRAMAALRLVQDEVRYFALVMGEGGYVPASADQTWGRKFGDCKAKTALLLALLDGLGIEAEPVLVQTLFGDLVGEALPQLAMFNHVIVRARIDGRSYWLDGTNLGDRRIEDLSGATFRYGLPLRAQGAALEVIPPMRSSLPMWESLITYDGSAGLTETVPFKLETVFRGRSALELEAQIAQLGREAYLQGLDAQALPVQGEAKIVKRDLRFDPDGATFTLLIDGETKLNWTRVPGSPDHRFQFDNDTISWDADFDRPPGPFKDAPFALTVPFHKATTETVILPSGGAGFRVEAKNFDQTVAGVRISRQVRLEGERAIAHSTIQMLQPEIKAAEARASAAAIEKINKDAAYLRSPSSIAVSPTNREADGPEISAQAWAHLQDGFRLLSEGIQMRAAIEHFDRAIAAAPKWSLPRADKGVALVHLGELDKAEQVLKEALRLDENEFVVHQGMGLVHLARGRSEDAARSLSRSLELDPENTFTLMVRAGAYEQLGRFDEALADLAKVTVMQTENSLAWGRKARLEAHLGRQADAIASMDAAVSADPEDPFLTGFRGELLARFGRKEEADRSFRAALRLLERKLTAAPGDWVQLETQRINILSLSQRHSEAVAAADAALRRQDDNVTLLTARCEARVAAATELDLAARDCARAVEYDSGNAAAVKARGLLKLRQERWQEAIADFSQTLEWEPRDSYALYGRAIARMRSGDQAGAEKDRAEALRYTFDTRGVFDSLGFRLAPAEEAAAGQTSREQSATR